MYLSSLINAGRTIELDYIIAENVRVAFKAIKSTGEGGPHHVNHCLRIMAWWDPYCD